ncbi:M23/M56 family metallopeptidase [Parvularcula lutaonensis]|uniref:M23/M56 family metallopeptidase n=1 Tax=Parvularcula lutaonensis TaxID=491923 RepID=A0ABV7MDJ6_9PROT|nr:M23/M56 family metallopeptidase [Parvularcula lutaonensis]GGY53407.1 hypothetical protein GCM10007148_23310 [Parvularcula lutaonensis]
MSFLSVPALLTWLVLPSLFAITLLAVRLLIEWRSKPALEDTTEKRTLALMLLPFVAGAAIVPFASYLPGIVPSMAYAEPLLLAAPDAERALDGAHVAVARPAFFLPVLLGAYVAMVLWRLARIQRARRALSRIAAGARPSVLGPDVATTAALRSPVVCERGTVLLPEAFATGTSPDELALIIAHERAHHARGDQRYFVILALIDAVFWAHPAILHQTARCRLAAELACDEAVCRQRPEMRKAYAELIVRALHHAAGSALPCAPAVFSPRTKGEFGMRLTEIMRPRARAGKRRGGIVLAAAVGLPLVAGQVAIAQQGAIAFTVAPVETGKVTSSFGMREHPIEKRRLMHRGTDIGAALGTPIQAPAAGIVTMVVESDEGYGNMIEISHADGVVTRYGQLDTFSVRKGERLRAGEVFATVGQSGAATGPHLHLEVFIHGERVDPETIVKMPARR